MRRKLLLFSVILFVLLCSSLVVSVNATSMWSQTYDGGIAYSLISTFDGGYALAGINSNDFWLVKTDAVGNMEWNKTYGGGGPDEARSLVATSDGGYTIAGTLNLTQLFIGTDIWLVKTDALGNMQWNRTYGGAGWAASLVATSDGGYALAGNRGTFDTGFDCWLVKTDALGNTQWNQTYGGIAYSLIATADGGYAIAGYTSSLGAELGDVDFWCVKTDALGNTQWNKTYGGTGGDLAFSLVATSDGGYALAGQTRSFGAGDDDFWLVKTDALGNVQWNRTYGGTGIERARSLVVASDEGYAVAGTTDSSGAGKFDYWLVKTDALGNMLWNQTYGKTWYDYAYSLVATSDGGYAITGYTTTQGTLGAGVWLVKTDENGVVPEYSSWLIPAVVLTATAFIIINKKKLNKRSK